jgi:hypothetical protein
MEVPGLRCGQARLLVRGMGQTAWPNRGDARKGKAMTETNPAPEPRWKELILPLTAERWAVLNAYYPMSDREFDRLIELLNTMRSGLTAGGRAEGEAGAK